MLVRRALICRHAYSELARNYESRLSPAAAVRYVDVWIGERQHHPTGLAGFLLRPKTEQFAAQSAQTNRSSPLICIVR